MTILIVDAISGEDIIDSEGIASSKSMDNDLKNTITAVGISSKYHLSYQTVNYYTNLDLLPTVKNKGNKRIYDAQLVDARLKQIDHLKSEGYPLRLIKKKILNHELL